MNNKRAFFTVIVSCMAITLFLNSSNTVAHHPIAVQRTDLLKGIQGIRWHSDHEIVYTETLKTGLDAHHQPIYKSVEGVKDLLTGEIEEEKVWNPGETRFLSPDSKSAYVVDTYMEGENIYASHTIEDMNSHQVMKVPLKAVSGGAVWLDNEQVLYMGGIGDGGATKIDLQGHITAMPEFTELVEHNDKRLIEYVTKAEDRLYFLETAFPSKVPNLNYIQISQIHQPSAVKIREGISKFEPAPDGRSIAVLSAETKLKKVTHELFLIDPDGNRMGESISTGRVIEHLAWSHDNLKLAYASIGAGKSCQIKVFDMRTGKSSVVFEGSWVVGELHWSPDSRQLMLSVGRTESSSGEVTWDTNIMQFR